MDKYEKRRAALRKLVDSLGRGGVSKIADRIDKQPSYVSRMLYPPNKDGFKRIGEDTVDALDKAFPGWMGDNVTHGIQFGGPRALPIISYVQAGKWREIVDAFPRGSADEYVKPRNEHGPHAFALYVEGDSMASEFTAGDIIIVDPDVSPHPGNYVIARNHDQEATFKKYRPRGRNADGAEVFELVPLNDDYATLRSDTDGAVIIGTVVEHIRVLR